MFGFDKKKKIFERKHKGLDQILMGVILGGAIGSVLGIGLATKKGSETRKYISKTASQIYHDAKDAMVEGAHKVSTAVSQGAQKVSEVVSEAAEIVTDKAIQLLESKDKEKEREKMKIAKNLSARDQIKEIPEE